METNSRIAALAKAWGRAHKAAALTLELHPRGARGLITDMSGEESSARVNARRKPGCRASRVFATSDRARNPWPRGIAPAAFVGNGARRSLSAAGLGFRVPRVTFVWVGAA